MLARANAKLTESTMIKDINGRRPLSRRDFVKMMSAAGLGSMLGIPAARAMSSSVKAKIVVIGGGAAGISTAARLLRWLETPDVTIIDPSDIHYYQPGFTLIASGVYSPDEVYKPQSSCMPSGAKWIKDSATFVDAKKQYVDTLKNGKIPYDFLVLAPGLKLNWAMLEGANCDAPGEGDAHCIYTHKGAIKMWEGMQKFVDKGGRGIFADTYTKHKCGGAPKKVCLLTEHLSRMRKTRDKLKLDFYTASPELYDVPFFTPRLLEIYKERGVNLNLKSRITAIDTSAKKVRMEHEANGVKTTTVEDYDFLHYLPPMTAPDFVKNSGLSIEGGSHAIEGWAATDKNTLVHLKYPNIVCLGDVAGIPTSKTSAAIRKQSPIAAANLICLMEGKEPSEIYDGYAACPIVTDYGHVLMCEFDYDKKPKISFPLSLLDMSKEQWVAWLLKVYALKPMYFYGMLKGYV